jgi:hypothetical protein
MRRWIFAVVLALGLQPAIATAGKVHGALILDEAKKLADGRYESQKDWEKTLQFFGSQYGKQKNIVWRRLETTPKVSGHFIQNTAPNRTWDGILLYQAEGKIFISVLKANEVRKS